MLGQSKKMLNLKKMSHKVIQAQNIQGILKTMKRPNL